MTADPADLQALLDAKGLLTNRADIGGYTTDLLGYGDADILAVARPRSTEQVADILRWCAANRVAVIPQGGLTGLANGAVSIEQPGALILSLSRMDRIREIDPLGNTIEIEAGAVLANVKAAADDADRYFPLTHGGEGSSQIGGNLSTNSGGNNALRYGVARDQVLGLEVVLPDGTVWNGLRRLRKNTAGYDLKHLFIGAEGTLGIITAATLKIRPKPEVRETAFVAVANPEAALAFLRLLESHVGESVSAFELLSANALARGMTVPNVRYPLRRTYDWLVLLELESATRRFDLKGALEDALGEALEAERVIDAVIAQSHSHREDFWKVRESIPLALIEEKDSLKTDTAVAVDQVPAFIEQAAEAVQSALPGAVCVPFGHAGDGNVHFNVCRPATMTDEGFRALWPKLSHMIEKTALGLGGTISAEHGLGRLKRADFSAFADPVERELMQQLKTLLDPDGRMNPGAIL